MRKSFLTQYMFKRKKKNIDKERKKAIKLLFPHGVMDEEDVEKKPRVRRTRILSKRERRAFQSEVDSIKKKRGDT